MTGCLARFSAPFTACFLSTSPMLPALVLLLSCMRDTERFIASVSPVYRTVKLPWYSVWSGFYRCCLLHPRPVLAFLTLINMDYVSTLTKKMKTGTLYLSSKASLSLFWVCYPCCIFFGKSWRLFSPLGAESALACCRTKKSWRSPLMFARLGLQSFSCWHTWHWRYHCK